MAAALIGVGEFDVRGARVPAAAALAAAGLAPVVLGPKEGLALLNGTQFSTAYALAALIEAETVFRSALVSGALSTEAAKGTDAPFDARIHALRGHRGQIECGAALRVMDSQSLMRTPREGRRRRRRGRDRPPARWRSRRRCRDEDSGRGRASAPWRASPGAGATPVSTDAKRLPSMRARTPFAHPVGRRASVNQSDAMSFLTMLTGAAKTDRVRPCSVIASGRARGWRRWRRRGRG